MIPYNQKYLVFDTETEGLNLHSSKTWQLSWLICEGDKIVEEHDEFIAHKELVIPEIVKKITGFDWDKYNKRSKSLSQVWSKFEDYLYDPQYIIIGQNLLGFDVYMLAILQKLLGQEPDYSYISRIYDTRALGKAYRENLDKPKNNFLSWQYKVITPPGHESFGKISRAHWVQRQAGAQWLYFVFVNDKTIRRIYQMRVPPLIGSPCIPTCFILQRFHANSA